MLFLCTKKYWYTIKYLYELWLTLSLQVFLWQGHIASNVPQKTQWILTDGNCFPVETCSNINYSNLIYETFRFYHLDWFDLYNGVRIEQLEKLNSAFRRKHFTTRRRANINATQPAFIEHATTLHDAPSCEYHLRQRYLILRQRTHRRINDTPQTQRNVNIWIVKLCFCKLVYI